MNKKINVAVLMGGKSAEHEVSLQSAQNVIKALTAEENKNRYQVIPVGLSKSAGWMLQDLKTLFLNSDNPKTIALAASNQNITLNPGHSKNSFLCEGKPLEVDVVFPVLHGTYGEDGTVQGLLRMLELPFVGSDVLGSCVGMDKVVMKRLLTEAKIRTARFKVLEALQPSLALYEKCVEDLGSILFVKPANAGSSVGVHKVKSKAEWQDALSDAFIYDTKVLVEECIEGREIECSVMGYKKLTASLPGEIVCHHDFYSYEAKYLDPNGARAVIPVLLGENLQEEVRKLAIETAKALYCEGLARVDMFITSDDKIYINEVNTMPGFTNISMYPKMWEVTGLSQPDLIHELIQLALARHKDVCKLKTNFF